MKNLNQNKIIPGRLSNKVLNDSEKIQLLYDREVILQIVSTYAYSLDKKDWEMHRALFVDDLQMDFSVSIGGDGGIMEVKADDWVAGAAKFFDALDATQHDLTPYKIVIEGDEAYVSVMLHAQHYKKNNFGSPVQIMVGTHNFWMRKSDEVWKIYKVIEELSWNEGNYKVFDLAVEESSK